MKILITGANGMLAKAVREELKENELICTDVVELDITDENAVNNFVNSVKPSYIINCAAYTAVDKAEEQPELAYKINDVMVEFFKSVNVDLIDFKIEFGRFHGEILLADEISPHTCRFRDMDTQEKLDKDRFRRDMGGVEDAYAEMMKRVGLN